MASWALGGQLNNFNIVNKSFVQPAGNAKFLVCDALMVFDTASQCEKTRHGLVRSVAARELLVDVGLSWQGILWSYILCMIVCLQRDLLETSICVPVNCDEVTNQSDCPPYSAAPTQKTSRLLPRLRPI
jgi:hypothetical protein